MKGIVFYVALLVANFWMYQEGNGAFQPVLLMSIIPYMTVLSYLYSKYDDAECIILHVLTAFVCGGFGMLVISNRIYYMAAVLAGLFDSFVYKFVLGDYDARRYARRFKMQNYMKWGVLIVGLAILMEYEAENKTAAYPVGTDVCDNYIVFAFGLYLLLVVLFRYMFLQYEYFRQRNASAGYTIGQLKRMNGIMAVVVTLLIGIAVLLLNETVVKVVKKAVTTLSGLIMGGAVLGLSNIKTKQTDVANSVNLSDGVGQFAKNSVTDSRFPVEAVVIIILLVCAVLLLIKIYKNIGANYTMENDEAEYITIKDRNKTDYGMVEAVFENNNSGKVRKLYYKQMNPRIDRSETETANKKTPKELAEAYGKAYEQQKLSRITKLYEKVRYSNEECTKEEIGQMKELTEDINSFRKGSEQVWKH